MWPRKCSLKLSILVKTREHTWHVSSDLFLLLPHLLYILCRSKWYLRVKSRPHTYHGSNGCKMWDGITQHEWNRLTWHENGFPVLCDSICSSSTNLDGQVALQHSHGNSVLAEWIVNRWRSRFRCDLNDFGQKLHFTWPTWAVSFGSIQQKHVFSSTSEKSMSSSVDSCLSWTTWSFGMLRHKFKWRFRPCKGTVE